VTETVEILHGVDVLPKEPDYFRACIGSLGENLLLEPLGVPRLGQRLLLFPQTLGCGEIGQHFASGDELLVDVGQLARVVLVLLGDPTEV